MTSFIAVICGLKSEAAAVRKTVDGEKIRIGVSGADGARAYELARVACQDDAAAVVSVGVSGGLDPALKPGGLVIGDQVIADDGAVYEASRYLLSVIRSAHAGANRDGGKSAVIAPIFGSDAIIQSAAHKAALFANHGAVAVDMESHGCARAAAEAGAPFIAIRAIADPADRALPTAALGAVAPDGSTRVFKTLGAALRDPKQFPELIKIGADSNAALTTLRRELGSVFAALFDALDL